MARVIAATVGDVWLIETRTIDGVRQGQVYERSRDELHQEFPIVSIAARGYWDEVDPTEHEDVLAGVAGRLAA